MAAVRVGLQPPAPTSPGRQTKRLLKGQPSRRRGRQPFGSIFDPPASVNKDKDQHLPHQPAHRQRLMRIAGAAIALLLSLLAPVPAWAQGSPQVAPSVRHTIGLYVTALHGLDPTRGTFGASLWVWSVGSAAAQVWRTMEFANADRVTVDLETTEQRGAVSWSQRRLTGTFRPTGIAPLPVRPPVAGDPAGGGRPGGGHLRLRGRRGELGLQLARVRRGLAHRRHAGRGRARELRDQLRRPRVPSPGGSHFTRLRAVLELERTGTQVS